MSKEGAITNIQPEWLKTVVPAEYEDNDLFQIILFFVIHSPCQGQSSKGISLEERGWKPKPWYSPSYLKNRLDKAIWGDEVRKLEMTGNKSQIKDKIKSMDLDEGFYNRREIQRALYVKTGDKGCENEYMSLFYHIRNSLAHGRLAMYPTQNNDIAFVMEDGKQIGGVGEDKFEISARIVINKSSLMRIIAVLKNPPAENDYSEDILHAIRNGYYTKKAIMEFLSIDTPTYEKFIQKLKLNQQIEFKHNKWNLVENDCVQPDLN